MIGSGRKFRNRRVRITLMTQKTWQPGMVLRAVLKLSVIQVFGKLHLCLRQLRTGVDDVRDDDNAGDCRQSHRDEISIEGRVDQGREAPTN